MSTKAFLPPYDQYFNGFAIQANEYAPIDWNIMSTIFNHVTNCAAMYGRALVVPFGLNFPQGWEPMPHTNGKQPGVNDSIVYFFNLLQHHLRSIGETGHYIWVRERKESSNYHYHCILIIDGNKFYNTYNLVNSIQQSWNTVVNGIGIVYHNWEK